MLICNAIILSNFNYCPLIWLFSTKAANNEINCTHKRTLKILFKDYDSSFDELLVKSRSVKIHVQNFHKLMIEIYKALNNLKPSYIWGFHEEKVVKYDLRTYVNYQKHEHQNLELSYYPLEVACFGTP